MASPLSLFRKYQKAMLAVFGVMIMFAFVVVPPIMDFMQSNQMEAIRQNDVVVTWAGGKVDETQLGQFRMLRQVTVGFLDNTKSNFDRLATDLGELLRERYGVATVVHRKKANASTPAAAELIEELAKQCDVVFAGSAD